MLQLSARQAAGTTPIISRVQILDLPDKASSGRCMSAAVLALLMRFALTISNKKGSKLHLPAATVEAGFASAGGDVMTVLFSALIGGFALGQAAPNLQYFQRGKASGAAVFAVIARKPGIGDAEAQQPPTACVGSVQLRNVHFAYPARPENPVFRDFSLTVPSGKTVALVGESGSGKSTVVGLIERFYDPQQGQVSASF